LLHRREVAHALILAGLAAEQFDHPHHARHRGADLVAHGRQELALGAGCGLGIVACRNQLLLGDEHVGIVPHDAEQAGRSGRALRVGLDLHADVAGSAATRTEADATGFRAAVGARPHQRSKQGAAVAAVDDCEHFGCRNLFPPGDAEDGARLGRKFHR